MGRRRRGSSVISGDEVSSALRDLERMRSTIPDLERLSRVSRSVSPYEDRRFYHPAGEARRVATRGTLSSAVKPGSVQDFRLKFQEPFRVLICARRKVRREVLHAFKLTGKGSKARRHRRNEFSGIDCR